MNPDLVRLKLESLDRCLGRIREKTPATVEEFLAHWDAQDLVLKNLERAVQVCVDVANHLAADLDTPPPGSMAMAFFFLGQKGILPKDLVSKMQATIGLRNLAVHEYESLDYGRVYLAVTTGLGVFEDFARTILKYLEN